MKILLVYPEMKPTFMTMDYLNAMAGKKSSYPPLGLLTVAALLPASWTKRLVDINVEPLRDADLMWADYVFLGAMNVQTASARAVIAQCRQAGVKIVAGGPLFTHEYESFEGVDHFVLNEAELTLPLFLADLEAGSPQPLYQSTEYADVHATPVPLWDLVNLQHYVFGIIQYSRGCPYECDFCDVTALFGRRPRTKTPEQILAELDALGDLGQFEMVFFADDNLIGNKKRLKRDLLPALVDWRKKKNRPVGFGTQVTVNLADDEEMMQQMMEAGFRHIFVGIETPSEEGLLACKKRQNTKRDLLSNIHRLQGIGFNVYGGLIVGFDTDDPSIFRRQIDFLQETGIVTPTINVLKAPPGTELYDRLKREDRLIEPFDFDENATNIIPLMDINTLYEGYGEILKYAYGPQHVYERALTFMTHYRHTSVEVPLERGVRARNVATVLRIVIRIGLFGKTERRYFWKLVVWTLRHCPSRLEFAFLVGVMMYQFRKMHDRFLDDIRQPIFRARVEQTRARQQRMADRPVMLPVLDQRRAAASAERDASRRATSRP